MPHTGDKQPILPSDEDIIREAREHMALVTMMESEIRDERKRCGSFLALEQWDPTMRTQRGNRPTLTVDQLRKYKKQVVNDWRRNRLGIKISPADGAGTDVMAELIEGDIRQSEYISKAHISYDWALDCMVGLNAGFFKVYTKRRQGSFKQDMRIGKIPNPDCVYMDQFCQEADYSDQRRCLIVDRLGIVQYREEYGDTVAASNFEAFTKDQTLTDWINKDGITVGEYWKAIERPRKIQLLNKAIPVLRNGSVLMTDTVYDNEWDPMKFPGVEIMRGPDGELVEDDEPERIVYQYILNAVEVISKTRWLGQYIPIVPMLGEEVYWEGKKRLFSLISSGLDTQRAINYAISSLVERLGQFPKNPYMGLTGQFKTDEKQWASMNTNQYAYLQFDPVQLPDGTTYINAPQRADGDPRIDQFVTVTQLMQQLLQGNIGIYGANLGDREGRTRSGAAERALQQEGDNAIFDFLDNGARGIELAGKIMVDIWPKIRKGKDTIQIRNNQNQVLPRAINQPLQKGVTPKDQQEEYNVQEAAQYSVIITAAPSHETKRQEDAQFALNILENLPPEEQVKVTPIMLRHQDSTVAQEMAEALDPQKEQPMPPQAVEQINFLLKTVQALSQEVQQLNQEKDSKLLELSSKEKIAAMQADVDKLKIQADALMKHEQLTSQEHISAFQGEMQRTLAQLNAQIEELSQARDIEAAKQAQMADIAHQQEMATKETAATE